jgi:hypothetical protein
VWRGLEEEVEWHWSQWMTQPLELATGGPVELAERHRWRRPTGVGAGVESCTAACGRRALEPVEEASGWRSPVEEADRRQRPVEEVGGIQAGGGWWQASTVVGWRQAR